MRQVVTYEEFMLGQQIASYYDSGYVVGWPGEAIAQEQFYLLASQPNQRYFTTLAGLPAQGKKMFLWQCTRKILGEDTKNYPQQIGDPFVAGTMVLMADGSEKAIEDIKIGEIVINHKGESAKVHNIIKRQFTGDLVTIKLKGWHRPITATESHHGMVLPYNLYRFKYTKHERKKFSELNVGEYMLIPFGIQSNEDITLDIKDYIDNCEYTNELIVKNSKTCKRFIRLDVNFARFIGLYLAEGGVSYNRDNINFSLHVDEVLYMQEIKALAEEIFGITSFAIHKVGCDNCRRAAVKSTILGEFFHKFIPGKLHTKRIPKEFFRCGKLIKLALLRGWLDGDGHKLFNKNAVIGYTSSDNLGNDMTRLAISCGLNVRTWRRLRKKRVKKHNTEVALYGTEPYKVYTDVIPTKVVKVITCNNTPYGFARPITQIVKKYVENETVYCITTENEYTAIFNGIAQHQCISFGAKNAIEYLICVQNVLGVAPTQFRPIYPPYLYGCGRVFIGKGRIKPNEDGSVGAWQAQAVQQYGAIASDEQGVPPYSGQVAKQWGGSGPPRELVEIGKKYPVKSAAQLNSFDDVVTAITNGYPCTVASNQGFQMEPDGQGFHNPKGNWGHNMSLIGVDAEYKIPYAIVLNSWGDCCSSDTEVLTEQGFKLFKDVALSNKIATLNQNNWQLEYQYPTKLHNYKVNTYLYHFYGRDIDLLVTNNHRLYHCKYNNDKHNIHNWRFSEAESINQHSYIKKDAYWEGEEVKSHKIGNIEIDMDDWLRFLGYFISEGCSTICKRSRIRTDGSIGSNGYSYRVTLYQNKSDIFTKIQLACDKIPFTHHLTSRSVVFTNKLLYNELKSLGKAHHKHIPLYVKKLSKRQLRILFDAMMEGDGSYSKCKTGEKVTYYTSSKQLADDMQELCMKIDFCADVSKTDRIGRPSGKKTGITRYIEYRVGIKRYELMQHLSMKPLLIPYNDNVYCVSVPNGTIYVRRNGKACWIGNCHGHLKDFETNDSYPVGTLRVRAEIIDRMIKQHDSFAYSHLQWFQEQKLSEALFKLI